MGRKKTSPSRYSVRRSNLATKIRESMTYKGYTVERLKEILDYDPVKGDFRSKKTGKLLVDRSFSHRDEVTKKVTQFSLARVAIMLMTKTVVNEDDRVLYKDEDVYNLKYDNLYVVPYCEVYKKPNNTKNTYLETEEDHIFVGSLNGLFVVRRDSDQATYRTYSKEEAIGVRDRWLASGRKLHELDSFYPEWYKRMLKEQEMEQ